MPTMDNARLEDLLLEQFSTMRYAEAKSLVMESRRHLKMSRIQPWDDRLREECERRYGVQIADTDQHVLQLCKNQHEENATPAEHTSSTESSSSDASAEEEVPPLQEEEREEAIEEREEAIEETAEEANELSKEAEAVAANDQLEEEQKAESKVDAQVSTQEHEEAKEVKIEEEQDEEAVEDEEDDDDDDDDDEADGYSQASDHSQCFTTAEEVGISKDAIAAAIAEAEKAEADDLKFVEERKDETKEVTKSKPKKKLAISFESPAKQPKDRSDKNNHEDHITIDTAENSELSGIPTMIYIRDICEVPANEPLGESYNIPLPLLLANAKKSRVRKLRERLVRRLRRWGLYRRDKGRLSENDHEVYFQTLVDL